MLNLYITFTINLKNMKSLRIIKNSILFLGLFLLMVSCGPGSIEDQVEQLVSTSEKKDVQEIAYSLADSLDIKASKLLIESYPLTTLNQDDPYEIAQEWRKKRIITWGLQSIIERYSQINDPKIARCLSYITDPSQNQNLGNDKKLDLIIFGLTIDNYEENFDVIIKNSAVKHKRSGMLKLINHWNKTKDNRLVKAIEQFNKQSIDYLTNLMVSDKNAVELLARIGEPVISRMKREMRSSDRKKRFAAGDVLVKMIQYHPDALNSLTSAISKNGTRTIARNYPFYIRLGQKNTEQILLKALRYNFSTTMCLDYLNCGNTILENGATTIASDNGYIVTPGIGNHGGPIWGSGN